jgi:hypothetical protein
VEIVDASASAGSVGGTDLTIVELDIADVHGQSCAALIEETLARDPRGARATVDPDQGRASVTLIGAPSRSTSCARG